VHCKLALASADRTVEEQELSLYGALKLILAEQVEFLSLLPAAFFLQNLQGLNQTL
jgi:hypothetical protein